MKRLAEGQIRNYLRTKGYNFKVDVPYEIMKSTGNNVIFHYQFIVTVDNVKYLIEFDNPQDFKAKHSRDLIKIKSFAGCQDGMIVIRLSINDYDHIESFLNKFMVPRDKFTVTTDNNSKYSWLFVDPIDEKAYECLTQMKVGTNKHLICYNYDNSILTQSDDYDDTERNYASDYVVKGLIIILGLFVGSKILRSYFG